MCIPAMCGDKLEASIELGQKENLSRKRSEKQVWKQELLVLQQGLVKIFLILSFSSKAGIHLCYSYISFHDIFYYSWG